MTQRLLIRLAVVVSCLLPNFVSRASDRLVFGHYMGMWEAGGDRLANQRKSLAAELRDGKTYQSKVGGAMADWPLVPWNRILGHEENAEVEIRRAMRAGLDGFAIDAWAGGIHARNQFDRFIKAAERMKVPFCMTICLDPDCHHPEDRSQTMTEKFVDTAKWLLAYAESPNLARFRGKPLVFTYHAVKIVQESFKDADQRLARIADEWKAFRSALQTPIYLHGDIEFLADWSRPDCPWEKLGAWAGSTFDGVGAFLGKDTPWCFEKRLVSAVKKAGADWCQPVWAQYQNKLASVMVGPGLSTLRKNWEAAIANESPLLQFVTWNDYGEATHLGPGAATGYTLMDVNRYYSDWWKTGIRPRVVDESIHAVYRRSLNTAETQPLSARAISRDDILEIVTFLASPARVCVDGYGEYEAPAGMSFRQFPLHIGTVAAHAERVVSGRMTNVLELVAPEVVAERGWREDNAMVCWSSDIGREWKKDFPNDAMPVLAENADDDGDGMPNWFEMLYFGRFPDVSTSCAASPDDDPDHDRLSNLEEFRHGTNPLVEDTPYAAGFSWSSANDFANDLPVFNPQRDVKGRYVWLVPGHELARNEAKTRVYWNGVSFLTNGVIRLAPKRNDQEVSFAWRAPVSGVFSVDVSCSPGDVRKNAKFTIRGSAFSGKCSSVNLKKGDIVAVVAKGAKVDIKDFRVTLTACAAECQQEPRASGGVSETLPLPQSHARIVAYDLVDQTDGHDELVHVREWLLGNNEHQPDVTTSILSVEDMLSGSGTVLVRCAPLPHARANPSAADFGFSARDRSITVYDTGYPYVKLPYEGGDAGRTKALQDWQRTVRPYVSGRDSLFLSNTWGDRNRDTRINEAFLLDEVKAAAELGVEVVQVDDGWQSGKSMNSAYADGKGVWNGYWAVSPDFWVPDPKRFPHGLSFVTKAAAEKGIRFGLWYGPDSSNDAVNWERDADWLLKLHRECGVDYFKLDSMKTEGALSLARQKKLFDKVLGVSGGKIVIDMDVTAEKRPGYFGMMAAGPLFVENRYSDYKTYWPHLTLRALWSLSEVIDPVRLRMEVLNPLRNRDKYGDDPLAPAAYPPETLLAIVLPASPLGWFEVQNLDPSTVAAWKPIVATWKHERDAMAACNILPVGARPDGLSWTGFVFIPREKGRSGYGLFFRELAKEGRFDFDFRRYMPDAAKVTILSPRGRADLSGVETDVRDFVWLRLD